MDEINQFKNRQEAGEQLAKMLREYQGQNAVVYALPRGGVVTGAAIAKKLHLPLDLVLVRKIEHPFNPEFAIGAVSESGRLIGSAEEQGLIDQSWFKEEIERQKAEIERQREAYFQGRPPISAQGKIAIIVDDGIATGSTMLAAIEEVKNQKPEKIVVAVPVSPPDTAELINFKVDEFKSLLVPDLFFGAVGSYYENYNPVSDEEVVKILGDHTKG